MTIKKILLILTLSIIPIVAFAPDNLEPSNPFDLVAMMRESIIKKDRADYKKSYQDFKISLARVESSNDWTKYNPYGYIGKYQFGKDALEATGFGSIDFYDFIQDPSVFSEADQEKAMDRLLKLNEQVLRPYIREYVGLTILDSIRVTRSGILAAAHLAGAGNVKRFLESEGVYNPKDRMGTRLSDYLKNFSSSI